MTSPNKIVTINQTQLNGYVHDIMRQMAADRFYPDYVVGITRGGLIPATMISQYLDVKMHTLDVSFRDGEGGPESNLWMAEDAFGYVDVESRENPADPDSVSSPRRRKNILIVDDINDTGRTLQWIKDDWESGCLPRNEIWNDIWHHNVQFATIVDNESSEFKGVDFAGMIINKFEDPCWIEFPWENWWQK